MLPLTHPNICLAGTNHVIHLRCPLTDTAWSSRNDILGRCHRDRMGSWDISSFTSFVSSLCHLEMSWKSDFQGWLMEIMWSIVCLEQLLWRLCVIDGAFIFRKNKKCAKSLAQLGLIGLFVVVVCHPWNDLTFLLARLPGFFDGGLSRSLLRAATTRHCEFWYWSHVALRLKQWLVEQSVLRKRKISPSSSQVSIPTEAHFTQPTTYETDQKFNGFKLSYICIRWF